MDNINLTPTEAAQVDELYNEEAAIQTAIEGAFNASVQRSAVNRGKWKKLWDDLHVTYNLDRETNYTLSNKSGVVTLIENPDGDQV